jgi:hypothetical protein
MQHNALRRETRPKIADEHNNASFIVKDATGQALGLFLLRR